VDVAVGEPATKLDAAAKAPSMRQVIQRSLEPGAVLDYTGGSKRWPPAPGFGAGRDAGAAAARAVYLDNGCVDLAIVATAPDSLLRRAEEAGRDGTALLTARANITIGRVRTYPRTG
jgi:hypothetical protein